MNYVRERLRGPFQSQKISACGRHWHYCKLREGALQSQKGQKNLPAAGTYIIVNLERGWRALQSQKGQKIMPAAGTYSIVNYVREGLRGPFKAKKFLPAAGTYIVVNWERGLFQSQKISACGRHLRCCELREGALSKPKRPKIFCLWQPLLNHCGKRCVSL